MRVITAIKDFEYNGVYYSDGQIVEDHVAAHRLLELGFARETADHPTSHNARKTVKDA